MTIEEMKRIKKAKGYTYPQLAEWSGIPLGTIQKIFSGETKSPRYSTLLALEAVFEEGHAVPSVVSEPAAYYIAKRPGEYTIKDYYALPDDVRMELIDGIFYDMASPNLVHQRIAGEVHRQIADYISANKGSCLPIIAPMDVRLDSSNRTMIQPDVIIVCDKGKVKSWGIMGAPDFVLEVLSPSTKRKDCIKKLDKYMEAGVKEYWMIDPSKRKVIVYQFENEIYPAVYGMEGSLAVGIFDGKLQIDLQEISSMIQDYPVDGREDIE